MVKTQKKSVSKNAFAKFFAGIVKAMFQPTDKADFIRLKNFIC
jgi:hypothetical protein